MERITSAPTAELVSKLEEQARYFWAIDAVSSALGSTMSREELLDMALGHVTEATGASLSAIYVPNGDGIWVLAVGRNYPEQVLAERSHIPGDFPTLRVVLESDGPVAYSERLDEPSRFISPLNKEAGMQSWAAVTISVPDDVVGVLAVMSREYDAFGKEHLHLLKVMGQLIGLALSSTAAHERALAQADARLRDRLAEMEAIFSSMSDGLIICDERGIIVRANEATTRIIGLPLGEIIGQSVLSEEWNRAPEAWGEQYASGDGPLHRVLVKGEERTSFAIEMEVRGDTCIFSLSASPIRRAEGAVIVLRDITEEQKAQRSKEEFLSILSHELRSPLTVISGYAQVVRRKLVKEDMEREVQQLELIKEQVEKMSSMIADLVDASRLESGEQSMERERAELGELIRGVVGRVQVGNGDAQGGPSVVVSVESEPLWATVDTRRIDQVLTNLLSNAFKYAPGSEEIAVSARKQLSLPGDGCATSEQVLVTVTDQGDGVPPSERKLIFERTYRGQLGQLVNTQGLGLGLYICKLAVEAHGGEIGVQDGPGGVGSTFWFTLPVE